MQKVLTQLSRHYKLGLVTSKDKPQFLEEDKKYHFSPYFGNSGCRRVKPNATNPLAIQLP